MDTDDIEYILPLFDRTLYDENEIGYDKVPPTLDEVVRKLNQVIDIINKMNKKV